MTAQLTSAQARRIMLAAQGFGRPEPASVNAGHLQRVVDRVGQFQIDSVNVAVRAHYMPAFARLGDYDRELLHRAAGRPPRRVFEFWGHAAALIDVELQPAFRFRMQAHRNTPWNAMRRMLDEQPGLLDLVLAQVAAGGPLTARQIEHEEERTPGGWWNWSGVKSACEWLFYIGELTSAGRNTAFERMYDLPERVIPSRILGQPTPEEDEARLILARRAAAALGVFTPNWIAEYFYTNRKSTPVVLAQLVATGEVEPVEVKGWKQPAYLWAAAARPRRLRVDALVAPFDSLVFDRDRRSLSDRAVHPGGTAGARLLRLPVHRRRPDRGPGRPEGRPESRTAAGPVSLVGGGRAGGRHRRPPRHRTGADGPLAGL